MDCPAVKNEHVESSRILQGNMLLSCSIAPHEADPVKCFLHTSPWSDQNPPPKVRNREMNIAVESS